MTLTETIRAATCECGHQILEHHVNRCTWKPIEGNDPGERLRQVIWGPECGCTKSDAEALAGVFESLMVDRVAHLEAVLRLVSPEHITPVGLRQIRAVLREVRQEVS